MRRALPIWGTAVSFDLPGYEDDGRSGGAVDEVMAWLHRVDDLFSTWRDDTEISRIAAGALALDDASPEVREVLTTCAELRDATGGRFDITVGAHPGAEPRPGLGPIDPSGFVKGWALERAATLLALRGVRTLLLNAGGDVVVRSGPEAAEPWRVGVRHPARGDAVMAVLELRDGGVATSARYERGDHVLDPATGRPATEVASATVVGPDLGVADAWATALLVGGADALAALPVADGYEGLVVTPDDRVVSTAGLEPLRAA